MQSPTANNAKAEALKRQGHEHVVAQFEDPTRLFGTLHGLPQE